MADGVPLTVQGRFDGVRWKAGSDELVPVLTWVDQPDTPLLPWLGAELRLAFDGLISCSHCGRKTKKSFNQGYCFPCARKLARCDLCIVSPTRCHRAEGTCREPDWADQFCFSPHIVYLANSSGLKVGLTRAGNERNRWADQGAIQGLVIARCDTRIQAGRLEARIAEHMSDRTDWRKLVRGPAVPLELETVRETLREQILLLPEGCAWLDEPVHELRYPVAAYGPVKALNLDKAPVIEGRLLGIKGQYLLLDQGVVNLRRHGAYHIALTLGPAGPGDGALQPEMFSDS